MHLPEMLQTSAAKFPSLPRSEKINATNLNETSH